MWHVHHREHASRHHLGLAKRSPIVQKLSSSQGTQLLHSNFSLHFLAFQQVSDTCFILCKGGCQWEMLKPARGAASWEKENKTWALKIKLSTDGILSYCRDQIFSHRGNGWSDTLPTRSWGTQQTSTEAGLRHALPSPSEPSQVP